MTNKSTVIVNLADNVSKATYVQQLIAANHGKRMFRVVNVKKDKSLREYLCLLAGSPEEAFKGVNCLVQDMSRPLEIGGASPLRYVNLETVVAIEFAHDIVIFTDEKVFSALDPKDTAYRQLTTASALGVATIAMVNAAAKKADD